MYISELKSIKYKHKVKSPLGWRTRLYKPCTVYKKKFNNIFDVRFPKIDHKFLLR